MLRDDPTSLTQRMERGGIDRWKKIERDGWSELARDSRRRIDWRETMEGRMSGNEGRIIERLSELWTIAGGRKLTEGWRDGKTEEREMVGRIEGETGTDRRKESRIGE